MTTKKCPGCDQVKDTQFFTKGLPKCNTCNNARNRKAYAENPDAARMSRDRVRKFRAKKNDK